MSSLSYVFLLLLAVHSDAWWWVCSPQNCVLGKWSSWSACTATCGVFATKTRKRKKLVEEKCKGKCGKLEETKFCPIPCCKFDCKYKYGDWGPCVGCGPNGTQDRKKIVLQKSSCGGTCQAPDTQIRKCDTKRCCPVDCSLSSWGSWSKCDALCEQNGKIVRERKVLTPASCNGKSCSTLKESKRCDGPCCPHDCKLSQWSSWGSCVSPNGDCGVNGGTRSRSRKVLQQQSCGGTCQKSVDSEKCQVAVIPCHLTNWGSWSACKTAKNCGNGTSMRSRTIITRPICGAACGKLRDNRSCMLGCCPVDCVYSPWSQWSNCSNECGTGMKERTRNIHKQGICGGEVCKLEKTKSRQSCTKHTNIDCIWGDWGSWSDCSSGCGVGTTERKRAMSQRAKCRGKPCGLGSTQIFSCTSYREDQDCKVGSWSAWEPCLSKCSRSTKKRFRRVVTQNMCRGLKCPSLEELAPCGEVNGGCSHVCIAGVCSCLPGYHVVNKTECVAKDCGLLLLSHCQARAGCKEANVLCPGDKTHYPTLCTIECPLGYRLHGKNKVLCQSDGQWSQEKSYCQLINKVPSQIVLSNQLFPENQPVGFKIAQLSSLDDNINDTHTYRLLNDSCGCFAIVGNNLKTLKEFDYENDGITTFDVTIRSIDSGAPNLHKDQMFQLAVEDRNDQPKKIMLFGSAVFENVGASVTVGTLDVDDEDVKQTFTYNIMPPHDALFAIKNGTVVTSMKNRNCQPPYLRKHCFINYELQKNHSIVIKAWDSGVPSLSVIGSFNIDVVDVNDAPSNLVLSNNVIKENKTIGQLVGQFSAFDEDGDKLTFTLLDDDRNNFLLKPSGELYKMTPSDFETLFIHRIHVQVEDDAALSLKTDKWFVINVVDVNEPPVKVVFLPLLNSVQANNRTISVLENSTVASQLGKLIIHDNDIINSVEVLIADNDTFSLQQSHVACTKAVSSGVQCEVLLSQNKPLDFEQQSKYNLHFKIIDRNHSMNVLFEVLIVDCNDPPTGILINGFRSENALENKPGIDIGILTTLDEDTNQNHSYRINTFAEIFKIEGNHLKLINNVSLDFEEVSDYTLTITSTDNGDPPRFLSQDIVIRVSNINDPPSSIKLTNYNISENTISNTKVADVVVIDDDVSTTNHITHPCQLKATQHFRIFKNTIYTTDFALNYEHEHRVNVELVCRDGAITVRQLFVINVLNVDEPPQDIILSSHSLKENSPIGTPVADLHTVDPDNSTHFYYSILTNQDLFAMNGSTLTALTSFSYESTAQVNVEIQVTDEDGLTLKQLKTISILDINDPPNDILISVDRVMENSQAGMLIGMLSVVDEDLYQQSVCRLINSTQVPLEIINNKLLVSSVKTVKLNYEVLRQADIHVKCTDNGLPELSIVKTFPIYVTDANDKPYNVTLSGNTIKEDAVVGAPVGTLHASDEDIGQRLTFGIIGGDVKFFSIVNGSVLATGRKFRRAGVFKVLVKVSDNGLPELQITKEFIIEVIDVNEAPIKTEITSDGGQLLFSDGQPRVNENSPIGTVIGTVYSLDPDINNTLNFNLDFDANGSFVLDKTRQCIKASTQMRCEILLLTSKVFNFEEVAFHEVIVRLTDDSGLSHVEQFRVDVVDINDQPSELYLNGKDTARFQENVMGAFIADLTTEDEDTGQQFFYEILDVYARLYFEIRNSDQLYLKPNITFDYELKSTYNFTITTTDNGSPVKSRAKLFSVHVEDINEKPLIIFVSNLTIVENSPKNTIVGSISVLDPDNVGRNMFKQTHVCSVTRSHLLFDVYSYPIQGGVGRMNQLSLKTPTLNYELDAFIFLSIRCDDSGVPIHSIEQRFSIRVLDVNEPPYQIKISGNNVDENTLPTVIGTLSTQDEDNLLFARQSFNYTLLNANTTPFEICGNKLKTTKKLDYERKANWTLFIKSADSGVPSLSVTERIVVNVVDLNESPTEIALSPNGISENSAKGTFVGEFSVVDVDRTPSGDQQQHTYELVPSAHTVAFRVAGNRLQVEEDYRMCSKYRGCVLNFEKNPLIMLKVRVTDDGVPKQSFEKSVTVQLRNVNEPSGNLTLSGNRVAENAPAGFKVGKFSSFDEDANSTLTYTLLNDDDGRFTIDPDNYLIKNKTLNYETAFTHSVVLQVTDNGRPMLTVQKTFLVFVTDVNEPPVQMQLVHETGLYPRNQPSINENNRKGAVIGILEAQEPDTSQALAFSVIENAGLVRVGKTNCSQVQTANGSMWCRAELFSEKIFDFESSSTVPFTIKVTDPHNLTLIRSFNLRVLDTNDPPSDLTVLGEHLALVRENLRFKVIGDLHTFDQDQSQTHSYKVINNLLFSAQKNMFGVWSLYTTGFGLDYEKSANHSVTIETTDSGSPSLSYSQTIEIQVIDVNERPIDILLTSTRLPENSPVGTHIANISVVEADFLQTSHACTTNTNFTIINMQLFSDVVFDFETTNNQAMYISCVDHGFPRKSLKKSFQISIVNINEPPSFISITSSSVPENTVDRFIGEFVTVDPDAGDHHTYRLLNDQQMFLVKGNQLWSKSPFDFENKSNYRVYLEVRDNQGLAYNDSFPITVINRNDAPSDIVCTGETFHIPETSTSGTRIGSCTTFDQDRSQRHVYTVTSVMGFHGNHTIIQPASTFTITKTSGVLELGSAVQLNFTEVSKYAITVRSTDNGSPPMFVESQVVVTVTDVPHPLADVMLSDDRIAENSPAGSVVGAIIVIDPDLLSNHTCIVIPTTALFEVNKVLELVVKTEALNYELKSSHDVTLSCSDASFPNYDVKRKFTIQVLNINEAPNGIYVIPRAIDERNQPGDIVAVLQFDDPDNMQSQVDNVTLAVFRSFGGPFKIVDPFSLVATVALDFEKQSIYTMQVTIKDDGVPSLSTTQNFTLKINDLNDPPHNISLSNHQVREDTPPGTTIATLTTDDVDTNQTHTYTFLDDAGVFLLSGGDLLLDKSLDFETMPHINIVVESVDNGSPPLSVQRSLQVHVLDSNDRPSGVLYTVYPIPENTATNEIIATLRVLDQDPLQTHSCVFFGNNKDWYYAQPEVHGNISVAVRVDRMNLDYEKLNNLIVNVRCFDNGLPSLDVTNSFRVPVVDVNERASEIYIAGSSVATLNENPIPRDVVGELTCDDPDASQTFTYTLLGNAVHQFEISAANYLIVKNISSFNYEGASSELSIQVLVTDDVVPPLSFVDNLTIIASDVNEPPTNITIIPAGEFLNENTTVGSVVGVLSCHDPEAYKQTFTYSLQNFHHHFGIASFRSNLANLTLERELDYSQQSAFDLSVSVSDSGQPPLSTSGIVRMKVRRSDPCVDGRLQCPSNSTCKRVSKLKGECVCTEGYVKLNGVCASVDDCRPQCDFCEGRRQDDCEKKLAKACSPCLNDGQCTDVHLGYKCNCTEGFTGHDCSMNIDDCLAQPCLHNSTCVDATKNFTCICTPGYSGRTCGFEINECDEENPCFKGSCIDLADGYKCVCADGFTGLRCERNEEECKSESCDRESVCVPVDRSSVQTSNALHTCVAHNMLLNLPFPRTFAVIEPLDGVRLWKLHFERFIEGDVTVPGPWLTSEDVDYKEYPITEVFFVQYHTYQYSSAPVNETEVKFFAVAKERVLPPNVLLYSINSTCQEFFVDCYRETFGCQVCDYVSQFMPRMPGLQKPNWLAVSSNNTSFVMVLPIVAVSAAALVIFIVFFLWVYKRRASAADVKCVTYDDDELRRDSTALGVMRYSGAGMINPMFGIGEEEVEHHDDIITLHDDRAPQDIFSNTTDNSRLFDNPLFGYSISQSPNDAPYLEGLGNDTDC